MTNQFNQAGLSYLVTGASGFVGSQLCSALVNANVFVRAVSRKSIDISGVDSVQISDMVKETGWTSALRDIDVVIHLAARAHVMNDTTANPLQEFLDVNLKLTANLADQAAKAGVKRFVYVSSIKVNGEYTENQPFDESSMTVPTDAYAVSKLQAEQYLLNLSRETDMEVVVVRPPLVYGPGVKANFLRLVMLIDKSLPLPLAAVTNKRSLIYVGNLVDALIQCATHPQAKGQVYLVSDSADVSTPELIKEIAKALGRQSRLFYIPIKLIRYLAACIGRSAAIDRLTQSLVIDGSKIRRELGWNPPFTIQNGLKATADWYKLSKTKSTE